MVDLQPQYGAAPPDTDAAVPEWGAPPPARTPGGDHAASRQFYGQPLGLDAAPRRLSLSPPGHSQQQQCPQWQQQPALPMPLPRLKEERQPAEQWELMSSSAIAAATGASPVVHFAEYSPPPPRQDGTHGSRAADGLGGPGSGGGGVGTPQVPQGSGEPPLPPGVHFAAGQMRALMDSTAAFEPQSGGGGGPPRVIATTPSSSSSYEAAADHVMEGLLCPSSLDAMRKWAALLDPSFPLEAEPDEAWAPPGGEVPEAFSGGYQHATLLAQVADVVGADDPQRTASPAAHQVRGCWVPFRAVGSTPMFEQLACTVSECQVSLQHLTGAVLYDSVMCVRQSVKAAPLSRLLVLYSCGLHLYKKHGTSHSSLF